MISPHPQVNIKLTTSTVQQPLERRESLQSQPSETDLASEYDSEAVKPKRMKTQEELDLVKPRLKGKRFTEYPPISRDTDLSGLCSIM